MKKKIAIGNFFNKVKGKGVGITYSIGYRQRKHISPLDEFNDLDDYSLIKNPFSHWCADPFLFDYEGKHYVFAELANKMTFKGCVGVCCLESKFKKWSIVIEEKWHLSFPNIFKKTAIYT